ncbi:MAG TPA: PQQ-dependent sugar dehydrogenase [Chitinophagaceae bacterium]
MTLRMTVIMGALVLINSCSKEIKNNVDESTIDGKSAGMTTNLKPVDIELVAGNMTAPLGLEEAPDGTHRKFIFDQIGKIWIVDASGAMLPVPFLDMTSKIIPLSPTYDERGLIGFTFHPDYAKNGRFFVHYQAPRRAGGPQPGLNWNNLSRLSEFKVSQGNPNVADINSERVILEWDDPQGNHNGGTVAFGADGNLYISIGDGGAANDVAPGHVEDWYPVNAGGNGQDIESNLFGSILRLNVDGAWPYTIPADNPFVGKPGLDEIYAYGFRNPYRFSFDMSGSRRLFAGDAGQVLYEEISVVEKGKNYGWNVKEGTHCFSAANNKVELPSCPDFDVYGNKLIDPVIELNNWQNPAGGRATTIIGGNVYRGNSIPGFQGKYIFGTFSQTPTTANGELFISNPAGPGLWAYQEINLASHPGDVGYYLRGFGQDLSGEIYLAVSNLLGPTGNTGKIFKLVLAD